MGKIKNSSQNKRRNPLGVLTALLLIGFSTLFFTPIQSYAQSYALDVSISGDGYVWSQVAGIDCPGDCSETYDSGTVVTLNAAPAEGYYFAGGSGGCVSQVLTCKVTMDAAKTVTANFTTTPPAITTWAKTYGGTVNSGNNSST
ncbi:MAG: InlB B-repeat-containing protein [Thermodesulfobacteriota bacterium]